jgi:hypothetical protein
VAVLVGMAVGLVVGLASIFANMPMVVLVVLGALAGAVGVVAGLMLLVGSLDSADFSRGDFTSTVSDSFGWWLLLVALAVGGILVQSRQRALMRRNIREVWYVEAS